jgi:uncharacterized protein YycO
MRMNTDLQFVKQFNLQPGDRIVVPKSAWQLVQHHVLYLGNDDYNNHYISENVIGVGVKLTRVTDFFQNSGTVTRIERFKGSAYERKAVVQRALAKLGKPYSLINYNCESYVNEAVYNKAKSPQVGNAVALLGLALLIGIVINSD